MDVHNGFHNTMNVASTKELFLVIDIHCCTGPLGPVSLMIFVHNPNSMEVSPCYVVIQIATVVSWPSDHNNCFAHATTARLLCHILILYWNRGGNETKLPSNLNFDGKTFNKTKPRPTQSPDNIIQWSSKAWWTNRLALYTITLISSRLCLWIPLW